MAAKHYAGILLAAFALALVACDDKSDGGSSASASTSGTGITIGRPSANPNPTISGTPSASVTVGVAYEFRPTTTVADGSTLSFSIGNQPAWTTFDATTGALSGTPTSAEVGSFANIAISVSAGGSSAALAPFSIKVVAPMASADPTISGTPANSVVVGAAYSFSPTTTHPAGTVLTFSISNQPAWMAFNAATGTLSGTPTSSEVGTFPNIAISVSDGGASVALAPFSIAVAQPAAAAVTLSWMPPQANTNGTSLTNLAGYKIYYGSTATNLNQVVTVEGNVTTFVLTQLVAGTWYFAVAAINAEQVESALSAVVPLSLGS